ncbi:Ig-like domain-containing protein [Kordiimonas lacus]|uniref:RapA2 cadherin-like domain-containing protein n=1 Tax=Kordiimonas lacus TaxID=637679 RepID=A0A1G6TZC1_9PROT|nr:Ig-like domain-containing protein [Kordiimonas lacus]SDD34512.1 hypothetical protein SAMN04488071_0419 [Kordiimonas lacus]
MPKGGNGGVDNGTDDDDVIEATENKINGGDGSDIITGTDADDRVNAGDGDDTVTGGAGDDTLYGNDGSDTAVFSGDVRDYSFEDGKGNAFIVSGNDGTDTLKHIDTLVFDNFTLLIDGTNNAPLVEDSFLAVSEDGSGSVDLLAGAWDYEGEAISVVGGSATFEFDAAGSYDYLSVGETEVLVFDFTATDGTNEVMRSVTVTIEGVNDAPDAMDDSGTVSEEGPPIIGYALDNDSDVDQSDTLTVTTVAGGAVGSTITLASGAVVMMHANGTYSYDPAGSFDDLEDGETAADSFTYTVSDGNGGEDTATVSITITGVGNDEFELSQAPIDLGAEEIVNVAYLYYETFYGDNGDNEIAYDVDYYIYGTRAYLYDGDDIVQLRSFAEGTENGNLYNNWLYGDGGDDALGLQSGGGANGWGYYNGLSGGDDDDLLVLQINGDFQGYAYNSYFYGGQGNDEAYLQVNGDGSGYGWGNSFIYDTRYYANDGDDSFLLQQNATNTGDAGIYSSYLYGDAGNDSITVEQNGDGNYYSYALYQHLFGGTGDDDLTIDASDVTNAVYNAQVFNNRLYGQDGDDTLTILGSDETGSQYGVRFNYMFGGNGNDSITIVTESSSSYANRLYGEAGNDTLQSGAGRDYMWGGLDADTFVFADGFADDYVFDYQDGTDKIDVSGMSGVNSFDDLNIIDAGSITYIDFGGGDIIALVNVNAGDLGADDFIF